MSELKHLRDLIKIFPISMLAFLTLASLPAWAATIVVNNQTQFDAAVAVATQPGHADTIDATGAGAIDAGTVLALPGAATSVNLEFGTLGIGAATNDGSLTLGPDATVSFGQAGNPGSLNMGLGNTGILNINGAAITFNVLDGIEQFNVGLDGGTGIVNMTGGAVTFNDANATLGDFGVLAIGYPFGSTAANGVFNQSGGTVSLSAGALDLGITNGTGIYNLSNDALLQLRGGTVYIGQETGGIGVLNVSGNAVFDLESIGSGGQLYVGDDLGNGTITQNGTNSVVTLNVANIARFGSNVDNQPGPGGTGTYNLIAGTLKIGASGATFGMDQGGVGILNQSGGILLASAPVTIGASGTGAYNLSGGNANFAGNLNVGVDAGSVGSVNQTGGMLTISGGSLVIGMAGAGAYNLNGGVLQAGGANGITGSGHLNLGGGTLQVINSALSIGMAINLIGARSTVDTNNLSATFGGVLSGTGDFVKSGLGTLSLMAANTYTGATAISGGTLAAGGTDVFSADSATSVEAGGTLDLGGDAQRINNITLNGGTIQDGTLSSASGITSTGGTITGIAGMTGVTVQSGTTTMLGTNSYTGMTDISGGTLAAGGTNVFSAHSATSVAAGGTLDLGGDTQTINNITLDGGTIQNGRLNSADGITSTGGTITGISGMTGVTVQSGTTTILGTNSYTGMTDISGGALEVGDATDPGAVLGGDVMVDNGATLRGHGTITGNVTNNGTVFPGGTIGTLTINGNYVQSSGGTLNIEITPSTVTGIGYDQLAVTGSATLAGGLAVTIDSGNYTAGSPYEILTASGGVTGKFTAISYNPAFAAYITPQVVYQANGVEIELAPTPAATSNNVSDSAAFSSGRIYAANNFVQNQSLLDALGTALGGITPQRGAWLRGIGTFGHANGFDITEKGFVIGNGFALTPGLTLGVALSNIYTATNGSPSSVNGSSVGVYGYGIYSAGPLQVSGIGGVGHLGENIMRGLPTVSLAGRAASNGLFADAGLRVQYTLGPPRAFLTPYASVDYLHTTMGSAQETGAGILNLRYDAVHTDLGNVAAGVTAGTSIPVRFGTLVPWVQIGGTGSVGNTRVGNVETLGLFSATETAKDMPTSALTTGVGLNLAGRGPWHLAVAWNGQYGDTTSVENFTLEGRYVW